MHGRLDARVNFDVITYMYAISALANGGILTLTLDLGRGMRGARAEHNDIACNSAVAVREGGRLTRTLDLAREMRGARVEPNAIAYKYVISAC